MTQPICPDSRAALGSAALHTLREVQERWLHEERIRSRQRMECIASRRRCSWCKIVASASVGVRRRVTHAKAALGNAPLLTLHKAPERWWQEERGESRPRMNAPHQAALWRLSKCIGPQFHCDFFRLSCADPGSAVLGSIRRPVGGRMPGLRSTCQTLLHPKRDCRAPRCR